MSPNPSHTTSTRPRALLWEAIKTTSIPTLDSALALAQTQSPPIYQDFLLSALTATVRKGSVPLTTHLLDTYRLSVHVLRPGTIGFCPSLSLFTALHARGLDIDAVDAANGIGQSMRLIDCVVHDDVLVEWLLAHGARVDSGDAFVHGDGYGVEAQPLPLTESCAGRGSVATWKRIRERGARVGRRALHKAAWNAAAIGAFNERAHEDGAGDEEVEQQSQREAKEDMLRMLVEEEGLDVNALDSDIDRAFHWGTPITYAAEKPEGAGVVRWLLERGADPRIRGACGTNAFGNAKVGGSEEVAALLLEWRYPLKQDPHG